MLRTASSRTVGSHLCGFHCLVTVAASGSTPGVLYIVVLDEVSKVPGCRTVMQR